MNKLSFEFFKTQLSGIQNEKLDSYLNSPLYYMITGRNGAELHKSEDSVVITCKHPHIEDRLMVFPEIGNDNYELTASILDALDIPKNGIQLARYAADDLQKLQKQIKKSKITTVSNISIIEEESLDWRYPIRILDTGVVSKLEGSHFQKTRTKFNNAAKHIESIPLNQIEGLRFMKAALKFWEGNMIFNEKDTADMSEFYHEFFNIMAEHPESFDGLLFLQGRKPVGFSIWDQTNEETANSYISLSDLNVTGLSEFQTISACRTLNSKGVKRFNTGGSETESLDSFKSKFKPVESLDILSAEVTYKTRKNPNIQVYSIV